MDSNLTVEVKIKEWIEKRGIPVKKVQFHQAVSVGDTMENQFSHSSNNPSRNIPMWLVNNLLFYQAKDKFYATSVSNCIYMEF